MSCGGDFIRFRPWIILAEGRPASFNSLMEKFDYILSLFDGLNSFYVAKEKYSDFYDKLSVPANVTDGFIQIRTYNLQKCVDSLFDRNGLEYIFPWDLFHEGDKVAILGGGRVGKCFYYQTKNISYVTIVGIFDSNAAKIRTADFPVLNMDSLQRINYDYVLISGNL